jgi:hypothetical protein
MNPGSLQIGDIGTLRGVIVDATYVLKAFPSNLSDTRSLVGVLQGLKSKVYIFFTRLNSINLAAKKLYVEIGQDTLNKAALEDKLEKQALFSESFIKSLKNIIKIEKDEESQLVSFIRIIDRMRSLSLELESLLNGNESDVAKNVSIHLEKRGITLQAYKNSLEKDFDEILRQMTKLSETLRYLHEEDTLVSDNYELLQAQLAKSGFGAPKPAKPRL